MKLSHLTLVASIVVIGMASGCNGTITQPMQNAGTLSANFPDGTELLAQAGVVYSIQGSDYVVTGTDDNAQGVNRGDEVTITVPIESSVPYTVFTPQDQAEVGYYDWETQTQYFGNASQGQCSVTITQTSPTLMGTFQAITVSTAPPDTVVLRSGSFNANPQ